MKSKLLFLLMFLAIGSLTFTSCGDDETCDDGIQNQDETGIDCGGSCAVCPTCDDGIQNGTETGVDCGGVDCDACLIGAHGEWESSGDNIAPLLAPFATKLIANFNADGTYTVVQTDTQGAEITLSGTYTQTESEVAGIWDIVLNQSVPTQLTAQGIFAIDTDLLTYEVAQVDPAITGVTPPTAALGFGSTSGGFFAMDNVQTFVRL